MLAGLSCVPDGDTFVGTAWRAQRGSFRQSKGRKKHWATLRNASATLQILAARAWSERSGSGSGVPECLREPRGWNASICEPCARFWGVVVAQFGGCHAAFAGFCVSPKTGCFSFSLRHRSSPGSYQRHSPMLRSEGQHAGWGDLIWACDISEKSRESMLAGSAQSVSVLEREVLDLAP